MDGIEANGEDRQTADQGKRIRRQWTTGDKRRIVRHGVHVSVLNRWRTELRIGASGGKKTVRRARLLPVQVSKTQASESSESAGPLDDGNHRR